MSEDARSYAVPRKKKKRGCRSCIVIGLVLLLLLAGGVFMAPWLVPTEALRKEVIARVEARTGRTCGLESVSFGWWDGLTFEGFRLNDSGSGELPLLRANRLYLDVDLGSIIDGSPIVRKILVTGAHISIYRKIDGTLSYEDLLASSPSPAAKAKEILLSSAAKTSEEGEMSFQVKQIRINESSLSYRDGELKTKIVIPDMTIDGGDINGPMQLTGGIALEGGGGVKLEKGTLDLLENNALDPNGSGILELEAKRLDVAKLFACLGIERVIKTGVLEGPLSVKLVKLQPQITTTALRVRELALINAPAPIAVPDMTVGMTAVYNTAGGEISAQRLSITSEFLTISGSGSHDASMGKFAIDSGSVDTAKMIDWLVKQKLAEPQKISGTVRLSKGGTLKLLPAGMVKTSLAFAEAPLTILLDNGPASIDLTNQKVDISSSGAGTRITAYLTKAPASIQVPDCKAPAKLLLTGRCNVRATASATEIMAQLKESAADIPDNPYTKPAKLTVSCKAAYLLESDSLKMDELLLSGAGLNLKGKAALTRVSGGKPQISDFSASAGLQLATLTELLKLPPEYKDYSAAGPATLQLTMMSAGNGYGIAAKFNSTNMKLRRLEEEILHEVAMGKTAIGLNGVVDPLSPELIIERASIVCRLVGAAVKGRTGGSKTVLGYNLTAVPEKELMAFLGFQEDKKSPLQFRKSTFTGALAYEPGKYITFTRTEIDGGIGLGSATYKISGNHDFKLALSKKDSFDLTISKLNLKAASTGAPLTISSSDGDLHIAKDKVTGKLKLSIKGPAAPAHAILTGISPFIPELAELKLADYRAGGTLDLTGDLNANNPDLTIGLTGDISDGSFSKGEKSLYKDSKSSVNLKGHYNSKTKTLDMNRLLIISESGQASFSINQLSATQAGKSWQVRQGRAILRAADLSKLPAVCPMLMPAGTVAQGQVSSSFSVAGPLSALKLSDGVADFSEFNYRSEPDSTLIAMKKSHADFSATLNLAKPPQKPSKAPYAYMRDFDITDAQLKLDQVTVDFQTLSDVTVTMAMKGGKLAIARGATKFGDEGVIGIAGGIDFNPVKPVCTIHTRVSGAPLATIMNMLLDMTRIGEINSGLASLYDPKTGKPVRMYWRGLNGADIHATLKAEDGAFALTDVEFAAGKETGLIGFLLDKMQGTKGEKALGMKDKKKTYQFKKITGHLTAERGFIDISQIKMMGKNTADFEVKGQIKPDEKVDFRVYVISNVHAFIRPDNIVGKLPKLGDLDKDKLRKDIREAMEKLGRARKLSFKVEGTLGKPMPAGLDSMFGVIVREVMKVAGKSFLESKGKDLLKNIFK